MLFNSYEFLFLFLPVTFCIYFYLNGKKLTIISKVFLVLSSLFFYSWWDISYLPLIIFSILFNFIIGYYLSNKKTNKKSLLIFGIICNLALLGYYKYVDFFILNVNYKLDINLPLLELALPLAISFFTFQQIAYLVDSYRYKSKEYNLLNYTIFITFFPQLIAGPIVHHKEMMPQFMNNKNKLINYKNIVLGLFIFTIGLFKKVVIADTFAIYATAGFDKSEVLTLIEAWITSLSYTFQLYFDFSGYTDMAIGLGLLFNIKLPINFNSPYKSLNIQDFWHRWHITLSRFLKDYIYIPLGGNKLGSYRTYLNLIATFILGGFWHGAGWTFLFWGFLHGIAIIINRIWQKFGIKLNKLLAWFITFNFINITWVFFRADDFASAIKVIKGMFGFSGIVINSYFVNIGRVFNKLNISYTYGDFINISFSLYEYLYILVALLIVVFMKNSNELLEKFRVNNYYLLLTIILFCVSVICLNRHSEFIYFRF